MPTIPSPGDDRRGTLIALEPRIRAAFHPLYHEIARRRDLTPGAKLVYAVLCSYHQMFSDVFPGRERLANDTGLSAHQLVDATKALVKADLLDVQRRGLGQTNVYTLLRWPESPDIPTGTTVIPGGMTGDSPAAGLPIEEEDEQKKVRPIDSEEPDPATLWSAALDQLRGLMTRSNFDTYIAGSVGLRLDNGVLVVQARPDQIDALTVRFEPLVKRTLGSRPIRFVRG